jgi:hypothetical protein
VHHNACLSGPTLGKTLGTLLAALFGAGCPGPAPSGFSKGDHWTFPLVGPLEDGLLITAASVGGHGPYLFVIDPDANLTVIDKQVVDEAGLTQVPGPARVDETGSEQSRAYAELVDLKVGNLTIAKRQVMMVPSDFYNVEGRRVNGVLGHDVLAETLVFGFDREQGVVMLSTPEVFKPPPDAIAIKYQAVAVDPESLRAGRGAAMGASNTEEASRVGISARSGSSLDVTPLVRRVASAQIGDVTVAMHLDLGSPVSQLRESLRGKVKLTPTDAKLRLVDEVATVRQLENAGAAAAVTLGGATSSHVRLVPYIDKRFAIAKVDGSLGLDFFQPYAVHASWSTDTFYLKPRSDAAATAAARLTRWGTAVPACSHPGCVTATVTTTPEGIRLDIVRDPEAAQHALEVRLGVTPKAGESAAPLVVELPSKIDKISGAVPGDYDGATLTVLDVSPFTRPCTGDTGCVYQFSSAP